MPSDRRKLKELALKTRIYRFSAFTFAALGLVIFAVLFHGSASDGDLLKALSDPALLVTIFIPFLPAAVLAWKAQGFEKKYIAMLRATESKK